MSERKTAVEFARAEIGRPFVWGDTNCVMLAVRALDAQAGTDIGPRHRHCMSSALRAAAWSRRHGLAGLVATLTAEGCTPVDPATPATGDVLLGHTRDGQLAAHVYLGRHVLSSTATAGVCLIVTDAVLPAPTYAMRAPCRPQ